MGTLLPIVRNRAEYLASPRDGATYRAAVTAICRRHRLPAASLAKYAGGSTIVFAVGERFVVKLFEPIFAEAAETERVVLEQLQGRLAVPTPALHAAGELEGWSYVVMEQMRGQSLAEVWAEIPLPARGELCRRLGEAVAGLHALAPLPVLPGPDWPSFVRAQADACVEQQRSRGLGEHWVRQIPDFLAGSDLRSLERATPVLLHTEIMREHVLVEPVAGGWALSGLIDFEPARTGAAEYELGSVGIFLAAREPGLLRAFLLGYGYPEAQLTHELQRSMLVCTLLHRYSNLRWYLQRLPPRTATTLDELAADWFSFA